MVELNPNSDKLYRYYFSGIKEPIVIQARNCKQARAMMAKILPTLPAAYRLLPFDGETVSVMCIGITTKVENGKSYTWVGRKKTKDGWQETDKLKADMKKFDEQAKIIKLK